MDAKSSMDQSTMGALAEWSPPPDEEPFFRNIIRTLDELYPQNWRDWVINTPSFEDLFGEKINSDLECRLRFAVPTVLLAKAHNNGSPLSERRYKRIKRVLLSWPLGRALIYVPLNIMARIHPVWAFNKFADTIPALKPQLISREEASKLLKWENGESASCCSSNGETSKSSHSPHPPAVTKEPRVEDYMARQSLLLEKLCQMVQNTNENMNNMLRMERCPLSPVSSQASSQAPSYESDNISAMDDDWIAPPIVDEPAAVEIPNPSEAVEELADFAPGTKESEAKISKTSETYVKQGINCQRFNSEGWANIRYADVQKQFQAFPAFTSLKVNSNLATVTPNWQLVTVLEKMDLGLGAITHGLLQQRQFFQDSYKEAPPEVKTYISKRFLASDAKFKKTSDALLQYVCGKRAEVIQQRRGLYKPSNRTLNELLHAIPPSETHLSAEPKLADFVKEQGGSNKLFPGRFRKPVNTTTNSRKPPGEEHIQRQRPKSGTFETNHNQATAIPTTETQHLKDPRSRGSLQNVGLRNKIEATKSSKFQAGQICSHEWHIPRPSLSGSSDSRSRGGSASSQGSSSNHSTHSVSSGSLLLSAAHLARVHGKTPTDPETHRLGSNRKSHFETAVVTIPEETKDPDYWSDVKRAPEADTASIASSTHFTVVNGFTKHRPTKEPKTCCCSHSHQITVLVIVMTILFSACILAAICFVEMRMRKETGMYKYS